MGKKKARLRIKLRRAEAEEEGLASPLPKARTRLCIRLRRAEDTKAEGKSTNVLFSIEMPFCKSAAGACF